MVEEFERPFSSIQIEWAVCGLRSVPESLSRARQLNATITQSALNIPVLHLIVPGDNGEPMDKIGPNEEVLLQNRHSQIRCKHWSAAQVQILTQPC